MSETDKAIANSGMGAPGPPIGFWLFVKPYRGMFFWAILFILLSTALVLLFPKAAGAVLESAVDPAARVQLGRRILDLFLIASAYLVVDFLASVILARVGETCVFDLRTRLYAHLQSQDLGFFADRKVGDLMSQLSNDISLLRDALSTHGAALLSQTVLVLGALGLMLLENPRLALLIFAAVPSLILVSNHFSKKIVHSSKGVQDLFAEATAIAEEGLQGIRVVKCFGREGAETSRYRRAMDAVLQKGLKLAGHQSLFASFMGFLGFCCITSILGFGAREIISGRLSLPQLTSFLVYGVIVAESLGQIARLSGRFGVAWGGLKRVLATLKTEPGVRDLAGSRPLEACTGSICFKNVHFSYDKAREVIKGFDLEIEAGEVLAIVGPSGAGKTTLFNLIPRFYDLDKGSLSIDGRDIREYSQASLRSHMAIVPQEALLFGCSIRENLLYGRPDATTRELLDAAKDANAHDFIMHLPGQYETIVGERGANFSGGERQRLAIARAILRNPRILLLDEATSALDGESEHLVQEALQRLMKGRTTIIIAHRLSTIRCADRIAVIERGKLKELGTHQELCRANGLYARLHSLQSRAGPPDSPILATAPSPGLG